MNTVEFIIKTYDDHYYVTNVPSLKLTKLPKEAHKFATEEMAKNVVGGDERLKNSKILVYTVIAPGDGYTPGGGEG